MSRRQPAPVRGAGVELGPPIVRAVTLPAATKDIVEISRAGCLRT